MTDQNGVNHIIWFDEYAGSRYSHSDENGEWSQPVTVKFPFGASRPTLMRGARNTILAFWLDKDMVLSVSQVPDQEFGVAWSWGKQKILGQKALGYDAVLDSDGVVHVAYLNRIDTERNPAGIYYRHTLSNGVDWSEAKLVYPSLYLRGVTPEKVNITISVEKANETQVVYTAWDEQPLSKVYFSRSTDMGNQWSEPITVDSITESSGSIMPLGIDVASWNGQVMLVWKRGGTSADSTCSLVYQASQDQGQTWTMQGAMSASLAGCPQNSSFYATRPEALYWQATINNQIFMMAWDGSRWSDPQSQSDLSSAVDPSTNRPISPACWKFTLPPEQNNMMAVGCNEDSNGDIWFSTKPLGDLTSWYPPESAWRKPAQVFNTMTEASSLNLVADSQGNFHGLWLQPSDVNIAGNLETGETVRDAIFYTASDGTAWSKPVMVIRTPRGEADHLAVTSSPDDKLFATWQGNQTGQVYFSWANANRASNTTEWAEPAALPMIEPVKIAVTPAIAVWQEIVYVAYAAPVNEKRGIYLTISDDYGKTWTSPSLVFDAQAAGWEVAGSPALAVTPDGQLHVTWMRESLPGTRGSLGLFYSRSSDEGETWTPAETVIEGSIAWGKVITSTSGSLYHVWQEGDNQSIVHSRISKDQGQTWAPAESLAGVGQPVGPTGLFADPAGKVYLLRFFSDQPTDLTLQNWGNESGTWSAGEQQSMLRDTDMNVLAIAGAVTRKGEFGVLYTTSMVDKISGKPGINFTFTNRPVEIPAVLPTPVLPTKAAENIEATPTAPAPTVTPTIPPAGLLADPNQAPPPAQNNTMTGMIISIGLSGLIVVIGFSVLLLRKRIR